LSKIQIVEQDGRWKAFAFYFSFNNASFPASRPIKKALFLKKNLLVPKEK